jgi:peptidoglycan pentaglycine glycine transferase (the first glycine)
VPADEPDHPWQNISAFKRKFGGREVNLVRAMDLVYDDAAYERYLASAGHEPAAEAARAAAQLIAYTT